MKINTKTETLCEVHSTSEFNKQLKKACKHGKDLDKLENAVTKLATKEELDIKYKNHMLNDSKHYKNCGECHIEPDWLLVYKYENDQIILLLIVTGSHSEIF